MLTRSPGFAALLVARAVSVVGDGIGTLALVLHVQADQGTGTAVGLLLLAASLPRLLSPLTGTLADRIDRRAALAAGELGRALAGLRYTLGRPLVRNLTIAFFLIGLTAGDDVALPFLAGDLGAGERGVGALYAAVGVGLIAGYLVLARGGRRFAGLVLGAGVAAAGNLATGLAPGLLAAFAFQMVRGLGLAAYETSLHTTLQRSVPGPMLGRVFANVYGAANLAACVALLGAGPLLDATSARTVLLVSGGAGVASAGAHFLGSRPARWPSRSSPDAAT